MYVLPLFDLTDLSNFADDNFALTWNTCKQTAQKQMQNKLELITCWLKESGLKVNKEKPKSVCSTKKGTNSIEITLNSVIVISLVTHMNVLYINFSFVDECSGQL